MNQAIIVHRDKSDMKTRSFCSWRVLFNGTSTVRIRKVNTHWLHMAAYISSVQFDCLNWGWHSATDDALSQYKYLPITLYPLTLHPRNKRVRGTPKFTDIFMNFKKPYKNHHASEKYESDAKIIAIFYSLNDMIMNTVKVLLRVLFHHRAILEHILL